METDDPIDRWLASGAPFGGEVPKRIDTHCARVFLAGDRAWKRKKPVRTNYLDFTTPERRRAALAAELAINRRTAPDLYLAVHAVVPAGDGFALDGPGEAVDWLLEMRRFPDDAVLLDRVAHDPPDARFWRDLADRIAAFHAGLAPAGVDGAAALAEVVASNTESLLAEADLLGDVAPLARELQAAQARLAATLAKRSAAVVHGHGDLHLGNIALVDGQPVLFDALEFSEALATVDRAYDLAFLVADCWSRGLRHEANLVMNRWIDRTGDEEALAPMPLFLALRLAIRAHVTATRARQAEDRAMGEEARRLLALSAAMLAPVPPRLVAIGGLSGTGKSSVAQALAPGLGRPPGARLLRSDVLRKRLAGVPPEERLPPGAYGPGTSGPVYAELFRLGAAALAAGQAAILDAVFAQAGERRRAARLAGDAGARFDGLWLEAPLAVRTARVGARAADASDADAKVAAAQEGAAIGPLAPFVAIDASRPLGEVVAAAEALLAAPDPPVRRLPPGSGGPVPG
ncbi:MAG: AAA family ATPase [Sphingomonadaceae bacterium]